MCNTDVMNFLTPLCNNEGAHVLHALSSDDRCGVNVAVVFPLSCTGVVVVRIVVVLMVLKLPAPPLSIITRSLPLFQYGPTPNF